MGKEPKLPRNDIQKQGRILMLPVDCIEPFALPGAHRLRRAGNRRAGRQHFAERPFAAHQRAAGRAAQIPACGGGAPPARRRLAKLDKVPAILADYDDSESAALGLLENLQRSQLDPFDTARGIKEVIRLWAAPRPRLRGGWG